MGIPRQCETQQTHYLRRDLAFNTAGVGAGVLIGTVPSGSRIMHTRIWVDTAFNGTPSLQGGTTALGTNLFTNTDSAPGTVGVKTPAVAAGQGTGLIIGQDQDLFVSLTGTGITAGVATVIVEFVPLSNGG